MTSVDRLHGGQQADANRDRARAEAFERAVDAHYANLVRRLTVVLGNSPDAEDVAQEAYLRAYRAWDRFDGNDARGWLYTIALRLAFNEKRRQGRLFARIRHEPEPVTWLDPADPDLSEALGLLDPRTRAALVLQAVDGFTAREIGSMLGVAEGTVSSWISRGRVSVRRHLETRGPDRA